MLHCQRLNGPLHEHSANTYGVVRDSILNTSQYFHVTEGLVPDIMHDVLEGSAPLELLKHLITNRVITLDEINSQIENFPYSPFDIRDKPTTISSKTCASTDHSLKQKGTSDIN